jgi:hypothetical protein
MMPIMSSQAAQQLTSNLRSLGFHLDALVGHTRPADPDQKTAPAPLDQRHVETRANPARAGSAEAGWDT